MTGDSLPPSHHYTHHGHKLRLFTLWEAQFVTGGIIYGTSYLADKDLFLAFIRDNICFIGRVVGRRITDIWLQFKVGAKKGVENNWG